MEAEPFGESGPSKGGGGSICHGGDGNSGDRRGTIEEGEYLHDGRESKEFKSCDAGPLMTSIHRHLISDKGVAGWGGGD